MELSINPDLAYRRIAGEIFIVDAARSVLHELNGPAALIWEGLAAGKAEDRIVAAIVSEFDTDTATARADLKTFLKELAVSGLLAARRREE